MGTSQVVGPQMENEPDASFTCNEATTRGTNSTVVFQTNIDKPTRNGINFATYAKSSALGRAFR